MPFRAWRADVPGETGRGRGDAGGTSDEKAPLKRYGQPASGLVSDSMSGKETEVRVLTRILLVVLVFLALAPALVAQEKGRIDTAIASDSRETMAERTSLPAHAAEDLRLRDGGRRPEGHAGEGGLDRGEGATVRRPNTKFAETTTKFPGGATWIPFSYSKPNPQWAAGTYRVELYLGRELAATVKFTITK